jgi:hypothetical protein
MKAALVSATSLAALLAFEVGLDAALDSTPANAQAFTATPTSLTFGYVLLNSSGGTTSVLGETVTSGPAGATVTFSAIAGSPFVNAGTVTTLVGTKTITRSYTFSPTVTGPSTATATISSSGIGSSTYSVKLTGTAVAPVQSTTVSAFGAVRIGTTATVAAITVSNIGDGNLAPGGNTLSAAQLRGNIGAASSSVFTGGGGTFSLNDTHYTGTGTATTSAAFTYKYAPTAHTTSDSTSIVATFNNGSSLANNASQTTTLSLTGQGVGPTYESKVGSTTYSNSTAIGSTTVAAGTISTGAYKTGATTTLAVTLANISTDVASSSLTNLTLESVAVTGTNASDFSVVGFTTNTVLSEGQSLVVTLDFSGPTVGTYNADISFTTDQGTALSGLGAVFSYALSAKIPEPATIVTFGMGLAGLGFIRRRRLARRAGTEIGPLLPT